MRDRVSLVACLSLCACAPRFKRDKLCALHSTWNEILALKGARKTRLRIEENNLKAALVTFSVQVCRFNKSTGLSELDFTLYRVLRYYPNVGSYVNCVSLRRTYSKLEEIYI